MKRQALLAMAVAFSGALSLQAQTVWYQNTGNLPDWNINIGWSANSDGTGGNPGSPLSASDEFSINGGILDTTAIPFEGGTLLFESGDLAPAQPGRMATRTAFSTVANISVTDGRVTANNGNNTTTTLEVTGTADISGPLEFDAATTRTSVFDVDTLTGSGDIVIGRNSGNQGTYDFLFDDASGFTGELRLVHGVMDLSSDLTLANGSFDIRTGGVNTLVLDQRISVSLLEVGTAASPTIWNTPGTTLTATDLSNAGANVSGSGTVKIIPEPSTTALLIGALGLIAAVGLRRRR